MAIGAERVDDRDLGDLRAAQDGVRIAQAVYAFVSSRVAQRHKLTAQDVIEDDGTIRRTPVDKGEQHA